MKKQDILKGLLLCAFIATVATGCGWQQKTDADLQKVGTAETQEEMQQEEMQDISQQDVCPSEDLEKAQEPSEQEEIALEETTQAQ